MDIIAKSPQRQLAIVTWRDVRDEVLAVNKQLASLIDAINPDDDYKFVKADYAFGDLPIINGIAQILTSKDSLMPITHTSVNKKVQNILNYHSMPMFLTLQNDNEVFLDTGKRVIPLNLFHKGHLSGVYEAMDFMTNIKSKPIWSYAAGSRTIVMLPKITDRTGLKKLRALYHIPSTVQIKHLSDHWELFKYIAQSEQFEQKWSNTLLFFGKKWLTQNNDSPEWRAFKDYLIIQTWHEAHMVIDKIKFSLSWEKFAEAISLRRLQPSHYLIDQLKHIISIAVGNYPAFRPVGLSQESAPIAGLQKAFVETYALRHYLPTILNVCSLKDQYLNPKYLYYSLAFSTVLEGTPVKKTSSTIMLDLREMKLLIETLKTFSETNPSLLDEDFIQRMKIEYFHAGKDIYQELNFSNDIVKDDKSFMTDQVNYPSRVFCASSPLFNGCVRIEH